ncbi:hypothetical protein Psi02_48860 [Planotetraspora silvatica]|uniref:DUF3592 domain-containing protein n=1 Tax=Planotetraspora silvatica TaxID=234614 RepID=A0A8J3URF8_9ACTN|nr:DUF3592 domain-containing protein [Planotetraspora silvatica]GII48462.1 hypothetical protein Psi02_48860 [Planotetraspora silvatica]
MPPNLLLPLVLGVVGVVTALVGGGLGIGARRFRRRAERVEGEVVRLRPSRSRNGRIVYHPTVRFTTVYGQRVEAESPLGGTPPPAMPGDRVPVLYDPARPTRVRIDDTTNNGFRAGMIFLGTALAILSAALLTLLRP